MDIRMPPNLDTMAFLAELFQRFEKIAFETIQCLAGKHLYGVFDLGQKFEDHGPQLGIYNGQLGLGTGTSPLSLAKMILALIAL